MTGFAEPRVVRPLGDGLPLAVEPVPIAPEDLSARELDTLVALAKGERCKEIASGAGLSIKTISTYRSRAYKKLGITRHHEAVMYCLRNGLIDGPPTP